MSDQCPVAAGHGCHEEGCYSLIVNAETDAPVIVWQGFTVAVGW